jgi:excisionase family DNA binding protein
MGQLQEDKLRALTVEQVARRLQVEIVAVRGLIGNGQLRALKIGRALRIALGSLDDYLRGGTNGVHDEEPLSDREIADVQASLEAMKRGQFVTLEELEQR